MSAQVDNFLNENKDIKDVDKKVYCGDVDLNEEDLELLGFPGDAYLTEVPYYMDNGLTLTQKLMEFYGYAHNVLMKFPNQYKTKGNIVDVVLGRILNMHSSSCSFVASRSSGISHMYNVDGGIIELRNIFDYVYHFDLSKSYKYEQHYQINMMLNEIGRITGGLIKWANGFNKKKNNKRTITFTPMNPTYSDLSVPMTNLTVAEILYGMNPGCIIYNDAQKKKPEFIEKMKDYVTIEEKPQQETKKIEQKK